MQRMPRSIAIMSKMPSDAARVMLHRGEGPPLIIMAKPPSVHKNVKEDVHQHPRCIPVQARKELEQLGEVAVLDEDGWLENCECLEDDRLNWGCECGAHDDWIADMQDGGDPREDVLAKYGSHRGGTYGMGYRVDDLHLPETWIMWDGMSGGAHGLGANKFRWLCPTDEWGPDYDVVAPAIPNLWQHGYLCMMGNKPACHHEMWEEYWRSQKNDHIDPRRRTDRNETMFPAFVEKWKREIGGRKKKREPNPEMKWQHPHARLAQRVMDGDYDLTVPLEACIYYGSLQQAPRVWYEQGLNKQLLYPRGLTEYNYQSEHADRWFRQRRRKARTQRQMRQGDLLKKLTYYYDDNLYYAPDCKRDKWRKGLKILSRLQTAYDNRANRLRPEPVTLSADTWAFRIRKIVQWGEKQETRQFRQTSMFNQIHVAQQFQGNPRVSRAFDKWCRTVVNWGANHPRVEQHWPAIEMGCKEMGYDWYVKVALLHTPENFDPGEAEPLARQIVGACMKRESLYRQYKRIPLPERKNNRDPDWDAALQWGKDLRDNTEEWGKNLTKWGHRPERFKDLTGVGLDELEEYGPEEMPPGFHILAQETYDDNGYCSEEELMSVLLGGGAFRGLVECGVDPAHFAWTYKNGRHAVGMVPCGRFNGDFYTEFDGKVYKGVLTWRGSWGRCPYDEVIKQSTYAITWGEFSPEDNEA